MKTFLKFLLICSVLGVGTAGADEYTDSVEAWHMGRLERLQSPDGYLTLSGLYWLKDTPVELPEFGWAVAKSDRVVVWVDCPHGGNCADCVSTELLLDLPEGKERLRKGSRSAYAVKRGPWIGIRVKDSQAPTRVAFKGVERFAVDPKWRVIGTLESEVEAIDVGSVVGVSTVEKSPGWAVFQWGPKTYRARLIGEPDDNEFFLVFSDDSAGVSTYTACRFLDVERGPGNSLVLDFNKATNPACAFTHFATCPLPPTDNVFDFSIEAGEKAPRSH